MAGYGGRVWWQGMMAGYDGRVQDLGMAIHQGMQECLQGVTNAIPVGVCPDGTLVPQAVTFHPEAQPAICLHVQSWRKVLGSHLHMQTHVLLW